ncbi:MAG: 2Fe-2S iron-sulfur cluster-binding protein [Vicinamibacterales bacterium]
MTLTRADGHAQLMTLRVAEIRDEAERVRSFELRDPGGAELPAFDAGAHLQVEVELPDGHAALRRYSLFGDPADRRRYLIAVLLAVEGRGGSRFMHERIKPGSILRVAPPTSGFALAEATHTVLIAGGIGITAILSLVRTLSRHGRSYELHYAARTPARMAFRQRIEAIAGAKARFYFSHVERPRIIDIDALMAVPKPGTHVYVCGPPELLRAVVARGEAAGWPTAQIHTESFGPTRHGGDNPIEIRLVRAARTVLVAAEESVLDAILNAGVWMPHECRRGTCASCMTRVLAGEPDHRDLCLTPELRDRYMCPCVSRAHSGHLTLDL